MPVTASHPADGGTAPSIRVPSVLLVVGTRPELIKLAGTIQELRRRSGLSTFVVFTGQHVELVQDASIALEVSPDRWLPEMPKGRSLTDLMAHVIGELGKVIDEVEPACVVVQGDTASALAGAIASELMAVPLVHVEAGIRSMRRDDPFPEETIRRMISPISEFHFCFSESAKDALLKEGHEANRIRVVRNPLVDRVSAASAYDSSVAGESWILMTLHRRERRRERMEGLIAVVESLAGDPGRPLWRFVWHPGLDEELADFRARLADAGVQILAPLNPTDFLVELARARLIVTDSAGVAEECHLLGKPLLSYRISTEQRFDDIMSAAHCITESPAEAADFIRACLSASDRVAQLEQVPMSQPSAAAEIADEIESLLLSGEALL